MSKYKLKERIAVVIDNLNSAEESILSLNEREQLQGVRVLRAQIRNLEDALERSELEE